MLHPFPLSWADLPGSAPATAPATGAGNAVPPSSENTVRAFMRHLATSARMPNVFDKQYWHLSELNKLGADSPAPSQHS